ncbi:hypothetical protein [Variovorax paradoxus]|uniref:Uncharacterized protein n=1 Tax=Variovorax paradoxus (strain EPS) TaxID=595537 RepID=E6V7X0_VARPE|nr:hypothetical protein [Variovorax paradoxus]ADU37231.1 hypothetical protein Varpa_3044 [Variovorax paradoxus EPS]
MSERKDDTAFLAWKEAHCRAAEADFRLSLGLHLAMPSMQREAEMEEVQRLKRVASEKLQRFLQESHPGSGRPC